MSDSIDKTATSEHHPLVQLARNAVETYVREHRVITPDGYSTAEMHERAGVFVCIKKLGQLRGCIGTFEPTQADVALETIRNAVSSATEDWRFPEAVQERELPYLEYTVDVLAAPELVKGPQALDPKRYGVIVRSGGKRGLLLPDLEGVDTVEQQIDITRRKAGIHPNEPVVLARFEVRRYT
jgi:MEMO1 family protein